MEMLFIIAFAPQTVSERSTFQTFSGTYTVPPGMTRQEVYQRIRDDHDPGLRRLAKNVIASDHHRWAVVFFSLEPNRFA